MIDENTAFLPRRAVGRAPAHKPRCRLPLYIAAPSGRSHAERVAILGPVFAAVLALGYLAVMPAYCDGPYIGARPEVPFGSLDADVDDLLASVDSDLDALAAAAYVVVLPGGENLFEVLLAPSLGVPVVSVVDFVALLEAKTP